MFVIDVFNGGCVLLEYDMVIIDEVYELVNWFIRVVLKDFFLVIVMMMVKWVMMWFDDDVGVDLLNQVDFMDYVLEVIVLGWVIMLDV